MNMGIIRKFAITAVISLTIASLGGGAVYASEDTLPDDVALTSAQELILDRSAPIRPIGGRSDQERSDRSYDVDLRIKAGRNAGLTWNQIRGDAEEFGILLQKNDPALAMQAVKRQPSDQSSSPRESNGLITAADKPPAGHSGADDVTIFAHGFFDSQSNTRVYTVDFEWNNTNWEWDIPWWCYGFPATGCNVGGEDAIGLAFSHPLPVLRTSARYGQYGLSVTLTNPADVNQNGVIYKYQDLIKYNAGFESYNSTGGWVSFETTDTRCGVQLFGKYAHTWADTSLTSVAVSPSSIGVGFTSTANSWTAAGFTNDFAC